MENRNNMLIEQCHISKSLEFFEEDFRYRWNLKPYTDPSKPALFVGMYFSTDAQLVNEHKGFKLVLFGGADIPNVVRLNNDAVLLGNQFTLNEILKRCRKPFKTRVAQVGFKDYSDYRPLPLGDKIYCYQAWESDGNKAKYRYHLLMQVVEHYGKDRVFIGYRGLLPDQMRDIYAQSFINLQFNPQAGFTSAMEMAHMGRRSISNHPTPFSIPFTDIDSVIRAIDSACPPPEQIATAARDFLVADNSWLQSN